jgi:hypothetical protein
MIWFFILLLVSAAVLLAAVKVFGPDFPFLMWLAMRGRKASPEEIEEGKRLKVRQRSVGA